MGSLARDISHSNPRSEFEISADATGLVEVIPGCRPRAVALECSTDRSAILRDAATLVLTHGLMPVTDA
jgi:hypothetical protein